LKISEHQDMPKKSRCIYQLRNYTNTLKHSESIKIYIYGV